MAPRGITPAREQQDAALSRAVVYAFLSRAFGNPSPGRIAEMATHLAPAVRELRGLPFEGIEGMIEGLDTPLGELQSLYRKAFTLTTSSDCPDYETAYSTRDIFQQAAEMADIAGFYAAHGLQAGGSERERPDSIVSELEFMSFACLKEARALSDGNEDGLAVCRETQAGFLRDHLGCWGPGLGRRVEATLMGEPFYPYAGRLLTVWLAQECLDLQVEPAQQHNEPLLEWPEPDDGSCGADEGGCGAAPTPSVISFADIS